MRHPPTEPVQVDIHELLRDEMMHIAGLSRPRKKQHVVRAAYLAQLASRAHILPEHREDVLEALELMVTAIGDAKYHSPFKSRQKTHLIAARRALSKADPPAAYVDAAPAIEDSQPPVHADKLEDNAAGGDLPASQMSTGNGQPALVEAGG